MPAPDAFRGSRMSLACSLVLLLVLFELATPLFSVDERPAPAPLSVTPPMQNSPGLALEGASHDPVPSAGSVTVGGAPIAGLYDPLNGCLYVLNQASNTVSVVRGSSVIATVSVGGYPNGAALDTSTGYVYVANFNPTNATSDQSIVSIINGTSLVANVTVPANPWSVVFDPQDGFIYVMGANGRWFNVTVINGTSVLTKIPMTGPTFDAVYDASTGNMYVSVANRTIGDGSIAVLRGTQVVGTISVPYPQPEALAYDPANDLVYASVPGANVMVVINGTSIVGTPTIGPPNTSAGGSLFDETTAFDSEDGYLYVVESGNIDPLTGLRTWGGLGILNGTHEEGYLQLGNVTNGVVYDPANGIVYAMVPTWDAVALIRGGQVLATIPAGPDPTTALLDSGNGRVYVVNYGYLGPVDGNLTILPKWYPINLSESGLPSGASWGVRAVQSPIGFPTMSTNASHLELGGPNGSYAFQVVSADRGFACPGLLATVAGAGVDRSLNFSPVRENLTFVEDGLARGQRWSVDLSGRIGHSNSSTIVFAVPNGSYSFTVPGLAGWTTVSPAGTAAVLGPTLISIGWSRFTYNVTFRETGLPSGSLWGVLVGSESGSSSATNFSLAEPNGSYGVLVEAVPGFVASYAQVFNVNGSGLTLSITFQRETYPVLFVEFGLPNGSNWSVIVSNASQGYNQTRSSTGNSILFLLANGTYSVRYLLPPGITANASGGSITVDGKPVGAPTISTRRTTGASPAIARADGWLWAALASAIASLVVSLTLLAHQRRKRRAGEALVQKLFARYEPNADPSGPERPPSDP
ncbi:MAG TPA: YncE family protein [Thermoplasmata archaeon]|nr:YncE family protein [Thermoplasmata archaeon]